jgi:hypothetical protein
MATRFILAGVDVTDITNQLKNQGQPAPEVAGLGFQRDTNQLAVLDPDTNLVVHVPTGSEATGAEIDAVADLSAVGAVVKCITIPIVAVASVAEQDTGIDLPAKAIVLGVYLDVTTAEVTGGTKTVDVGLKAGESGGDADGFLDGVACSATGLRQGSLVSGAVTRGLLLKETVTDSAAATHASPKPHLSDSVTAKSITFTLGSNDFAELRASIILEYIERP